MNRKLIENVFSVMSGMGNVSYLWGHIDYFEDKIPEEIKPFIEMGNCINIKSWSYQKCHNFSAWIRIYTELICNKALGTLSHADLCGYALADLTFKDMTQRVIEKATISAAKKGTPRIQIDNMLRAFKMTIELRHSFQHGGLPTILRRAPILKGVDLRDIAEMVDPRRYLETKQIFSDANMLIGLLKRPRITLHQGGRVTFSAMNKKKKNTPKTKERAY